MRIRSLAAYIIGTLEFRFRKRQVTGYSEAKSSGLRRQDNETLSTGGEPSGRYTVWGDLSTVAGITRTLRSPASWAHFST